MEQTRSSLLITSAIPMLGLLRHICVSMGLFESSEREAHGMLLSSSPHLYLIICVL